MSSLWMTSFTVSPSRRQPVRHPLRHLLLRLIRSAPRLTRISAKMEAGRASIRQEHSKIRATAFSLSKLVSDRNSLHSHHVFCSPLSVCTQGAESQFFCPVLRTRGRLLRLTAHRLTTPFVDFACWWRILNSARATVVKIRLYHRLPPKSAFFVP